MVVADATTTGAVITERCRETFRPRVPKIVITVNNMDRAVYCYPYENPETGDDPDMLRKKAKRAIASSPQSHRAYPQNRPGRR